jgi:hypothetical protein
MGVSSWGDTEIRAELKERLRERAKVEIEKSAERMPVISGVFGSNVKDWVRMNGEHAGLLDSAADRLVDNILGSPGAEVDSARANYCLDNELIKIGTWEVDGNVRKFKPRYGRPAVKKGFRD